ncbi:TPA: hypothetical protein DEO28_04740 [Candidatus Dependentiae bacterium]|nr:MAG: hypothetical protein UR14_C0002G0062 [candidate division TM6 bacterium GW2011_GWE2_31_21]KKP53859.1 MAG: hypothetical protein UR43_C0002G0062 [candidate division TM6 bacterium GW2011_GWF2_33_332]HBS47639.1 hypothetical protein [Candidatus Dependentiae bacterium]HBZ73788.1 hypothetical protein [Candidatus Dependentiae bacterium]
MYKIRSLFILLILLLINAYSPINPFQYSDFDQYQETVSKYEVETKIKKFLQKDNDIQNYYEVTENELLVFDSAESKNLKNPEFVLRFGNKTKPVLNSFVLKLQSNKPLQGLKIALDPGHLGGKMAIVENRFIDLILPDEAHTKVHFDEGTLVTFTAKILKLYLTAAGADVLLTREEPGKAAFNLSFNDWCKQEFGIATDQDWTTEETRDIVLNRLNNAPMPLTYKNELIKKLTIIFQESENKILQLKQTLFRFCYNQLDLKARSEKINQFHPNLTIIIHLNSSDTVKEICEADYNLTFVPGSFLKGDLKDPAARYEFIRLLATDDLEESIRLSQAIAKNMETTLKIPLQKSLYMPNDTFFISPGVYCRNLALTRRVHSILCYGESLIQNNAEEAKRLATKDTNFNGEAVSSRIIEVANAYFKGICEYFGITANY